MNDAFLHNTTLQNAECDVISLVDQLDVVLKENVRLDEGQIHVMLDI